MQTPEVTAIVDRLRTLVEERYVFPDAAAEISARLAARRDGYPTDLAALAAAVTDDLQSVNGDKHLRLLHHAEPQPEQVPGDDAAEYAAMAQWAERTCGGVAAARRLPGDVGLLEITPVLFPAVLVGDVYAAAFTLLAPVRALIVDLRGCLGGEPSAVGLFMSYLWDHEPVQLTGMYERATDQVRQSWTHAHVPGRRYGRDRPLYVLTSGKTFSGGEALAYDVQQTGRGTVVGEQTRGGAHPREGFRLHPHLEATISVARAVNPVSGTNWESVGVTPDLVVTAEQALPTAYRAALEQVCTQGGPSAAEARAALDAGAQL
ncbi:S41 family peptidase [Catellatospora citrea]|uniref:Interphotoreceptor retinoid-binding protein n=1 Tax=Catellatospora citrea TaxID=53366 RepID=A0A8J3KK97_9ACTN|nr:S41 family peptidase [Catellatospora citrea]RKE11973.1 peptidase S41-like protein [Catellatospora citrea]GIG00404.1 interphotoreceptor retinoid-binding protein [Catellatospora citrea]